MHHIATLWVAGVAHHCTAGRPMCLALVLTGREKLIHSIFGFFGENAAEIIAVCALGLTVFQAHIARTHNKLSVRPHVTHFTFRDKKPGQGILAFRLLNNGVGPAFIKSFQFFLDGELVTDPDKALFAVLHNRNYNYSITTLGEDYAMPAGDSKDILIIVFPLKQIDCFEIIEKELNRFDLVIEYESTYKESARLDTRRENSER